MNPLRQSALFLSAAVLSLAGTGWFAAPADGHLPQQSPTTSQDKSSASSSSMPRGKKLILKDGSFQLVRSYERKGDRVRYLSAERGDWEEIPAAMVDWDATAKAETAEEKTDAALVSKVHAQEAANQMQAPIDVDASLQVAPSIFLPSGEGMFVLEGKSLTKLEQVGSQVKVEKKRVLEQVISPVPIVPSKHHIEIPGPKAKVRVNPAGTVEFYLREAPSDPDRDTTITRSSRPGEAGPDVELVRATVKGGRRQLEAIRSLFGQELSRERNTVSIERWDVAPTVYRFTLSEPLEPGEYALAEILPDGMNLYVWDFGVDGTARSTSQAQKH
jgi:hypothetical protein